MNLENRGSPFVFADSHNDEFSSDALHEMAVRSSHLHHYCSHLVVRHQVQTHIYWTL